MSERKNAVRIQYYGSIRAVAELGEDSVDVGSGVVLITLLARLGETYGERFLGEIFENSDVSRLRDDVMVTVNGTIVPHRNAQDIRVVPGDALGLMPIFPGGG